ncbi:hypothetical protein CXB49_10650 [Chromobacterium sp. ATCC 53434]|uniref:hypothetical protein n=1 Tax=Chromobacterium sp. (strain ATCC 53434 / SC 14030) TaxID=2059672 RepID=UPI000C7908FD|nr:hypothetical protein [Chromobacterium sp. ATCC 53434]AUH51237.1 hypothetical protein CXB49_10650 [Chromobacterium sp. ATCC 53434]
MSYGKYKRAHPDETLPPPPPLTPAQRQRAAQMRDAWREAFGDDQLIRDLLDAGMINGWRDVVSVTPIEAPDNAAS